MSGLVWVGVTCCIGALVFNLLPALAYELGADGNGVWSFFGFGVFLIGAGSLSRRSHCDHISRR